MHTSEFKAWFDGFTEAIKDKPTKRQWARIKERLAEVDGNYTPPQVFFDRYWYPKFHTYPIWYSTGSPTYTVAATGQTASRLINGTTVAGNDLAAIVGTSQWNQIGQAEAVT